MDANKKKFYEECLKNNFSKLYDEYEGQKINLLAKKYNLTYSQLSQEEFEKIKEEYEAWKIADDEMKHKAELETKIKNEKKYADNIDSVYIEFSNIRQKRRQELEHQVKLYEIYHKTSDEQWQRSLFQVNGGEGKANPYIMGGLAEGIGGAGVGLATFASTVADNARIDSNNKIASEKAAAMWLTQTRDTVYSGRYKYRYFKGQLDNVDTVYVSDNHDLARHLLAKIDYTVSETGCITLDITIAVDPDFETGLKRDVRFAIDGNFTLAITTRGKRQIVLETTVQLPVLGVLAYGRNNELACVNVKKVIPDAHLSTEEKYSFIIADDKLSLIETELEAFRESRTKDLQWITKGKLKSYYSEKYEYEKKDRERQEIVNNSNDIGELESLIAELSSEEQNNHNTLLTEKANSRIKELRDNAEKNSKRKKLLTAAAILCLIAVMVVAFIVVPAHKKAVFIEKYGEELFEKYGVVNDEEAARLIEREEFVNSVSVGAYVEFGRFEQDGNDSNGPEPIEWLVLDKEDDKALLISKYGLENVISFGADNYFSDYWSDCYLRSWSNNYFFKTAFNDDEQQLIVETEVKVEKNPDYDMPQGSDSYDKVFMLSIGEAKKYFSSNEARQCSATAASKARSADNNNCWWWLRNSGGWEKSMAVVDCYGTIDSWGYSPHSGTVTDNHVIIWGSPAVRPAMWVNLEP